MEWFRDRNGRLVIEGTRYRSRIEDRAWEMSEAEEQAQAIENHGALRGFIDELGGAAVTPEDREMTEFEWEQFFRHGDAVGKEFEQAIETYKHLPNADRDAAIGRAMGWRSPEPPSPDDLARIDELNRMCEDTMNDPEPEPAPLLEGIDWVRSEDGSVHHPLQRRVFDGSIALHAHWRDRGLLGDDCDEAIMELVTDYQILGAKLAGALNHLGYDTRPEGGFVIAQLKRALPLLDSALGHLQAVEAGGLIPDAEACELRSELFSIREAMLAIMARDRG
ncbi:MAG: hypothetical protein ACI8W8_003360 [Rhodothermales bacterium]